MFETAHIAVAFLHARHRDRLKSHVTLKRVQANRTAALTAHLKRNSPFYRARPGETLFDFPILEKASWLHHFNEINTAGLTYQDTLAFAQQQERDRTFNATLNGITVGLSTGTSGQRGVFLVSPRERLTWLGVMLAKLVPNDPLRRRKVAFVLRAGSPLYETAGRGPITFRYFDMLAPWSDLKAGLADFAPDMLIAPASVLRQLADEGPDPRLQPHDIISVAECLYPDDEAAIVNAFGRRPGEIYQATEGLLATRCELGALHLNEAYMLIEKDWIDERRTRFMPVVTDFLRHTQPIVRYRLDDILVAGAPCPCGRAAETLDAIEGRRDDVCHLFDAGGHPVPVFPDLLVRAVLEAAPSLSQFRVTQTSPGALVLESGLTPVQHDAIRLAFARVAEKLGAEPPTVSFAAPHSPDAKRRRVVNLASKSVAPAHLPRAGV